MYDDDKTSAKTVFLKFIVVTGFNNIQNKKTES